MLQITKKIQLNIAGGVCNMLSSLKVPDNIRILGYIDDLKKFYSSYDIYINPDTFYSGLKCKTLEA
ncbi:glycosyltransferase [Clostridium sp. OF13-4]|nr:glycosyltransferase [Clostridium sp. OF13-4]